MKLINFGEFSVCFLVHKHTKKASLSNCCTVHKLTVQVQKFLQEFCSLMGDHFTMLAGKEEKERASKAVTTPPLISEAPSSEEAQMREIISRPQVKAALSDPAIQRLITALKEDQATAQR